MVTERQRGFEEITILAKVEKVRTLRGTQVVTVDGRDFKHGTHRASQFHFQHLQPVTDELRTQIKDRRLREKTLQVIGEAKLDNPETDLELLVVVASTIRQWQRKKNEKGATT